MLLYFVHLFSIEPILSQKTKGSSCLILSICLRRCCNRLNIYTYPQNVYDALTERLDPLCLTDMDTYKLIALSGGKGAGLYAKVSPQDYDRCIKYSWRLSSDGYPRAEINGKTTTMQLFITGIKHTDHISRNKLDNRRSNLFSGGQRENNRNIDRKNENSTSKYPGVDWKKQNQKWRAQIRKDDGKNKHLGLFTNEVDAAYTYYQAAKQRHPHMQFEAWQTPEFIVKCVLEESILAKIF